MNIRNYFRLILLCAEFNHLKPELSNEDQKVYLRQLYYTPNPTFCLGGTEAKQKQGGEALLVDAQLSMIQLCRGDPHVS
jgi:hypothetical protein